MTYALHDPSFADVRTRDPAAEIRALLGALRARTSADPDPRTLDQIRHARRRRDDFFNPKLFADPAWDMLLDLYAREIAQQRTTVSSVCYASGAPSTTALRYIDMLFAERLITREPDPMDRRRKFVRLTPAAAENMRAYFQSLPDSIRPL